MVFAKSRRTLRTTEKLLGRTVRSGKESRGMTFPSATCSLPYVCTTAKGGVGYLKSLRNTLRVMRDLVGGVRLLRRTLGSNLTATLTTRIVRTVGCTADSTPCDRPYTNRVASPVVESLNIPLIAKSVPKITIVLKRYPSSRAATGVVGSCRSGNLLAFLINGMVSRTVRTRMGVKLRLEIVPLNCSMASIVRIMSITMETTLVFKGLAPKSLSKLLRCATGEIPTFMGTFKPLDRLIMSTKTKTVTLKFPIVASRAISRMPVGLLARGSCSGFMTASLRTEKVGVGVASVPVPMSFTTTFRNREVEGGSVFTRFNKGGART